MNTTFQKPWIRAVTTVLAVALMAGIFLFSHQGQESNTTSESFAFVIIDTVRPDYKTQSKSNQIDIWNTAQHIVRKTAHVLEYLALGFLLRLCLESWFGGKDRPRKKKTLQWAAFAAGALYAVSDEVHQYFVPGRSCEILDILMDSLGVFLGVLVAASLIRAISQCTEEGYPMEPWSKKQLTRSLLMTPLFGALLTVCLELGLTFIRRDASGSVLRHLAFFMVFTALMAGAVLLCAFTRPVRKFWAWLDRSLLSPETRKPFWDIAYAVLAAAMLLHHVYILLNYPAIPAGASKLAPAWIILAVVTVLMGKTWRHRGFLLASFFLIWTFETLYLRKLTVSGEAPVYFSSAVYALFLAYGVFFVLRPEYRRIFLQILCACWSLAALILCGAGLYTAWTGIRLPNLAGKSVHLHIRNGALMFFSNPNISGAIAGSGALMALTGFAVSRHRAARIAFLVPCLASLITVPLTDARASMFMLSLMLAGTAALAFRGRLARRPENPERRGLPPVVSVLACFVLCFALSYFVQTLVPDTFAAVRDRGGIITSSVRAESESEPDPEPTPEVTKKQTKKKTAKPTAAPDLSQEDSADSADESASVRSLSGRFNIWQKGLSYMGSHPASLLSGLTVDGSASKAVGRKDHFHNIYVQTLMEGGIPGLLLFLALLGYFLYHAVRLWRCPDLPLWQHVLPLPALSVLLLDTAECLSHFAFGHPPMTLLYFFMGCTVAVSLSLKNRPAEGAAPRPAEDEAPRPAES